MIADYFASYINIYRNTSACSSNAIHKNIHGYAYFTEILVKEEAINKTVGQKVIILPTTNVKICSNLAYYRTAMKPIIKYPLMNLNMVRI